MSEFEVLVPSWHSDAVSYKQIGLDKVASIFVFE
jgi:hypothetical protein